MGAGDECSDHLEGAGLGQGLMSEPAFSFYLADGLLQLDYQPIDPLAGVIPGTSAAAPAEVEIELGCSWTMECPRFMRRWPLLRN